MAATMLGPQINALKLIAPQLAAAKMAATMLGPQINALKLIAPQLAAAKMAATMLGPQINALKLIAPQLAAAKMAATMLGPQLDLLIGLTELERLFPNSSVLPGIDHSVAAWDREQIRQLWGQYIYVQVFILCVLLLLFFTMKLGTAENGLLTVFTTATGVSGLTVASKARKIAVDNSDTIFPPGRDMPAILNIML
jgi:hypothetical protein